MVHPLAAKIDFLRFARAFAPVRQRRPIGLPLGGSLLFASLLALSGCGQERGASFSFAIASEGPSATKGATPSRQIRFADGGVVLVAPSGHCVDPERLRQEADGGFALMPRCNLMRGASWIGKNRAALITATVGKAAGDQAPQSGEIARTAQGARLLHYEDKEPLSLVRLHWPGHGAMGSSHAPGASPIHWRGAFVLEGHLVVLALYAPEGSPLLDESGADLLRRMVYESRAATAAAHSQPQVLAPRQSDGDALRPRSRPASQDGSQADNGHNPLPDNAAQAENSPPAQKSSRKLSLIKRISGLFQ